MKKSIIVAAAIAAVSINAHAYTPVERAGFCTGNEVVLLDYAKKNNNASLHNMLTQRIQMNIQTYRKQNVAQFDQWGEIAIKAQKTVQERAEFAKDCYANGM